jgi:hypothetical protein
VKHSLLWWVLAVLGGALMVAAVGYALLLLGTVFASA